MELSKKGKLTRKGRKKEGNRYEKGGKKRKLA